MDLDLTGLWSWTVPLWGLGVLIFFLALSLAQPTTILTALPPIPSMRGGGSNINRGKRSL
jgi:hypothetical protein